MKQTGVRKNKWNTRGGRAGAWIKQPFSLPHVRMELCDMMS